MDLLKSESQRKKEGKFTKIVKSENVNDSDEKGAKKGSFLPQFIASIGAFIVNIDCAIINSWTSPALPYLKSNNSEFPVSDSQGGWIAALPNLSAIIGIMIFPLFIDKIGRTYSMLLFATLHGIGAVFVILAKNYVHLYIARIIAGIGTGGGYSTTIVYFGEIADKEVRGTMMIIMGIFAKVATLFVAVAGAYFTYHTMNVTLLSVSLSFIIFFFLMPETPHFYLTHGKDAKAVKTLMKLRGVTNPEAVAVDIQRIKKSILENKESETKIWREMFCKKACRKSLIVVAIAKATAMYSGVIAVAAYAQEILTESGSSLAPTDAAMILAAMSIVTLMPATQFIDRFGRRPLFLISGILSGISLGIVGFYFFLKLYLKFNVSSATWLPLVGLILFEFSCNMGFILLPLVFSSELFPLRVKGSALAFTNILNALYVFTSKLAFQALASRGGIYIPFLTFSVCCVIGSCIVFWIAPETKGKNLEEIQDMLTAKKNKSVNLIQDTARD